MRPPHVLQASTSNPKVRFRSSAHGRYVPLRLGGASSAAGATGGTGGGSGAMRLRHALAGARTPEDLMVWKRGGAAQGGEPGEQRQRVHLHSERPIRERTLQDDAHEAVLLQLHALLRHRRAENVAEKRLLPGDVVRAGPRRGMEREAIERRTERLVVPESTGSMRWQPPMPRGARGWRLARDGGRFEPPLGIVVALVVAGLEQAPAAEVPRHPLDRVCEHLAHLARLQMPCRVPHERDALFAVDAVENESVKVGMEPNVGRGSLDNGECACLAARRVRAPRVERLDALEEDSGERAEKRPVSRRVTCKDRSPREREREHPLPEGRLARENVLGKVRGRRAHAPAHARRAEPPTLARERHEQTVRAGATAEPREASAQDAAAQIRLELLLRMLRHAHRERTVVDGAVQRVEVVADNLVQRRRLGTMTRVRPRSRAWRKQRGGGKHTPRFARGVPDPTARIFPPDPSSRGGRRVASGSRAASAADHQLVRKGVDVVEALGTCPSNK